MQFLFSGRRFCFPASPRYQNGSCISILCNLPCTFLVISMEEYIFKRIQMPLSMRGDQKNCNLVLKNCAFTLMCLNFSHLQSTLHLMKYTYQDVFSTPQNSF